MSDELLKRQRQYSSQKHTLAIAEILLSLAFFIFISTSRFSDYIIQRIYILTLNDYIAVLLYIIIFGSFLNIITFWLDYTSSFRVEHNFGLSRQDFGSWLKDYLKKIIISGIISLLMVIALYVIWRHCSVFWWAYTAILYFFIGILFAKIFPIIIIPLFYKLTPISEIDLKNRLIALAQRAGVKVIDIYNIALGEKTKKANAAVCGIGSTKRILLSDTLLEQYTPQEIEATLAHELSHHKHQHFWKLSFYNLIFTLLSFAIIDYMIKGYGTGDIRAFPLMAIIFMFYNIITAPVSNYISRVYEIEADKDAIKITGLPVVFASLMQKLSAQNLSDPKPGRIIKVFFYDHPPAAERIEHAKAYEEKLKK